MRFARWWIGSFFACSSAVLYMACGSSLSTSTTGSGGNGGAAAATSTGTGTGTTTTTGATTSTGTTTGSGGSGGGSLFGPGCGATGQPCCNAEACEKGGCCVETVCVANGAACTAQNGYAIGTCAAGACNPCGGLGQPCCFEDQTANCVGGIGPGMPPCLGCTAPGTVCSQDDPQGTNPGTCLPCGAEGQTCCAGSECLGFYSLCTQPMLNTNVCSSACGGAGQPCCTNHVCRDAGCCLQSDDGIEQCVSAGACATCGGDGGTCCAGGLCDLSQFCNDAGTCETPQIMPP